MSLEMNLFLEKQRVPDRGSLQAAIDSLSLPLQLDPEFDAMHDSGFSPSKIKGLTSGFEIFSESASDLLRGRDDLAKAVGNRDWCISFRWGGDMNECACVLAASAGLVKLCDAIAYYPDDNLTYNLKGLIEEFETASNP